MGVVRDCCVFVFRRKPLVGAVVVAVAGASVGFVVAWLVPMSHKLQESIQVASVTLLFGTLLGGVIKLLLDDVQRERERRAEQARFIAKVLDDLKSVHDRVERTRILLPAHRSALTYGNEMRDLIDARVQLRNVLRALAARTSGISDQIDDDLRRAVDAMSGYLSRLTVEFQQNYKSLADEQRIHEALVTGRLRALEQNPGAPDPYSHVGDTNRAWETLRELHFVKDFIGDWSEPETSASQQSRPEWDDNSCYRGEFRRPLDLASWLLRSELRNPGKTTRADLQRWIDAQKRETSPTAPPRSDGTTA